MVSAQGRPCRTSERRVVKVSSGHENFGLNVVLIFSAVRLTRYAQKYVTLYLVFHSMIKVHRLLRHIQDISLIYLGHILDTL